MSGVQCLALLVSCSRGQAESLGWPLLDNLLVHVGGFVWEWTCSLSLENYHSIMLNTIRHLNNFQDGRKIQNGRQTEDHSHIYTYL